MRGNKELLELMLVTLDNSTPNIGLCTVRVKMFFFRLTNEEESNRLEVFLKKNLPKKRYLGYSWDIHEANKRREWLVKQIAKC